MLRCLINRGVCKIAVCDIGTSAVSSTKRGVGAQLSMMNVCVIALMEWRDTGNALILNLVK